MQSFELYNPVRVIFGVNESKNVAKHVQNLGKKALIVSYEDITFLESLLADVKSKLVESGIEVIEYYHVLANPLICHIKEAVEICKKENVDFCIGIGGGSVMDSTKVIASGALYDGDVWNMFVSRHDCVVSIPPEKSLPTVMIPTLPATSSEMNCIAVATNEITQEKAYISAPVLYPTISIMDPALTCTLPVYQTAVGAVDAMSHVLEAYLNGDQNSPVPDRLHEGLLVTIMDELKAIIKDPKDVNHRANMQWAASLAWNGYLQSGLNATTPMHQMGHVLSALYNTPHGVTLAIFMDSFFRYTCTLNEERENRFALLGKKVFNLDATGKTNRQLAEETVDCFVKFMDEVGVPHRLSTANIPLEDIEKIADEIIKHGCDAEGLLPSLPKIDRSGIITVLNMAK